MGIGKRLMEAPSKETLSNDGEMEGIYFYFLTKQE
jgi:hypothetical protein